MSDAADTLALVLMLALFVLAAAVSAATEDPAPVVATAGGWALGWASVRLGWRA